MVEQGPPKKHVLKSPVVIYLEVAGWCNLKCSHCFIGEKPQRELPLSEWKDIITQCAEMGVLILGFSGGEPLLRKDFVKILGHTITQGVKDIIIPTNGTVLPEGIFSYLEKTNAHITFMVSLDSHRQEFHDKMRGVKGTFQKVTKNLTEILQAQQGCALSTVITRENYLDIQDMWELMKDMGIKRWFLERIQPIGSAQKFFWEWEPSRAEWGTVLEFLFTEVYKNATLVFGDGLRGLFWMFRREPWFPQDLIRESSYPKCMAGRTAMTITATGDVIPCAQWRQPVDSVKNHTLTEIWDENSFFQKLRALRVDHIEVCRDCEEKAFCGGGCRGVACQTAGSIHAPNPYCPKLYKEVVT